MGESCLVWIRFDNLKTESEHGVGFVVWKVSNQLETRNLTKLEYELCSSKPSFKPETGAVQAFGFWVWNLVQTKNCGFGLKPRPNLIFFRFDF